MVLTTNNGISPNSYNRWSLQGMQRFSSVRKEPNTFIHKPDDRYTDSLTFANTNELPKLSNLYSSFSRYIKF
jgi:hypothetical protein